MDSSTSPLSNSSPNSTSNILVANQVLNQQNGVTTIIQQQQLPSQEQNIKLTIEQEEEMKLRIKYPNPQKPGGSAFIQKMLHKGNKKYFDSGDYNMAKSKNRALNNNNNNNRGVQQLQTSGTVTTTPVPITESINSFNQTPISVNGSNIDANNSGVSYAEQQAPINTSPDSTSPNIIVIVDNAGLNNSNNNSDSMLASSLMANKSGTNSVNMNTSSTPVLSHHSSTSSLLVNNSNGGQTAQHQQQQSQPYQQSRSSSASNSQSPQLSSSLSTSMLHANAAVANAANSNNYLSTSGTVNVNTGGILIPNSHSSTSLSILSSSYSSDKLSGIQINTNPNALLLLDNGEEIGYGIPTPECLPQSRKHSIVQSKLATPRLSNTSS